MKKLVLILFTGLTYTASSQIRDTSLSATPGKLPVSQHKNINYIIPVFSLVYGPLAREMDPLEHLDKNVRSEVLEDYSDFNTNIEDHLRYLPAASVYALGLAGVKGKHNTVDKTALFLISNTLTNLSVKFLKKQTHRLRPDGSDHLSFPSGHTATAFAGAEFMNQEYKDLSPWFGVASYAMATATGTLRLLNKKHWLSDVVMGAGVGIITTKLVYLGYPVVKSKIFGNKESGIIIVPSYEAGVYGFSMSARLK